MNNLKIIIVALAVAMAAPAYAQFRATNIATEGALSRIRTQAAATKSYLQNQRVLMVAATVASTVPLAVIQHLSTIIPTLTTLAATPGLATYARDQFADPAYDVVAEFNAMRTALVNLRTNLISTFPATGGFLAYEQLDPTSGTKTTRTFTAAQMAAAVALVDLAIASIQ